MSRVGVRQMAELRRRLHKGRRRPGDAGVVVRRDLLGALVGDIDDLTLALEAATTGGAKRCGAEVEYGQCQLVAGHEGTCVG